MALVVHIGRVRRLSSLLTVLSLLSGAALLTGCGTSPEQHLASARVAFDAGDYTAAGKEVTETLRAQPENAQARLLLARIALRTGDLERARSELDRAQKGGADAAAVREVRYPLLLAERNFEEAISTAKADAQFAKGPRLVYIAGAQVDLGRYDDAQKTLDEALASAPEDPDAMLVQARLLAATGKITEANAQLDRLLAREPDLAKALLLRAQLAMNVADAHRAVEALEHARKLARKQLDVPQQVAVIVGLVEGKLALGDLDGAEASLGALKSAAPAKAFIPQYLNARIAYARKNYDTALTDIRTALNAEPDNVPARLLLGATLVEQGALEQADAELSRLLADHPENSGARMLLARVNLARKQPLEAKRVLDEAPVEDARADWIKGASLLMAGRTEEGITLLEHGAAGQAGNVPLSLDLAQAYIMAGRTQQAVDLLRSLPAGQGGARRQQLTVLAEVAGKSPAQAKQAIDRLIQDHPGDAGMLVLSGTYLLATGDATSATDTFRKAIAADAKNADAHLGLAAVALQHAELRTGEDELRKVIELDPKNERGYLGMSALALSRNDRAGARQWLEKAIGANSGVLESRLRLAELAYADKDPIRANAMLDQALAVTPNRPATLNRIAQIQLRASQYEDALKRSNEAVDLGAPGAQLNAAAALVALGRVDEARTRLEGEVRAHANSQLATALLVRLDLRDHHYDAALARVATFQKAGGDAVVADDLRGQVQLASGHADRAVEAYEQAVRARPSSALTIKLYEVKRAAGQRAPETVLSDWLATHPTDAAVRTELAGHYFAKGDNKAAMAQYEKVVQAAPNVVALNNLGWIYQEMGDARALETAQRAHEMAPGNPEVADTYGWILLSKGRTDDALRVLEAAAQIAPTNPEIQFHYAAALARTGKKPQSVATLQKVLASAATFPSRHDAEALLQSLN